MLSTPTKIGEVQYRSFSPCFCQKISRFMQPAIRCQPLPNIYMVSFHWEGYPIGFHTALWSEALGRYSNLSPASSVENGYPDDLVSRNADFAAQLARKPVVPPVRVWLSPDALHPRLEACNAKVLCYFGANHEYRRATIRELDGSRAEACVHCWRKICGNLKTLRKYFTSTLQR